MSDDSNSVTLSKEEYENIISQCQVYREGNHLTLLHDSCQAKQILEDFIASLVISGWPLPESEKEYIRKWKSHKEVALGVMMGDETKQPKVFALLSKNDAGEWFLNLITSLLPFGDYPFDEMMLYTLHQIAEKDNLVLRLPKRYIELKASETYKKVSEHIIFDEKQDDLTKSQ